MLSRRALLAAALQSGYRRTEVALEGDRFLVNGRPSLEGRVWRGHPLDGLLLHAEFPTAIADESFAATLPAWRKAGLSAFSVPLQTAQSDSSAFTPNGDLLPAYLDRLRRVLDRADEFGFTVFLTLFHPAQDQILSGQRALRRAALHAAEFVLTREFRNVLLDIAAPGPGLDHELLSPELVPLLVREIQSREIRRRRLLTGIRTGGTGLPPDGLLRAVDVVLLSPGPPDRTARRIAALRKRKAAEEKPALILGDTADGAEAALAARASWGFSIPASSSPNTFFALLQEITQS